MPPQITCASTLPGKTLKHKNCVFNSALPELSQLLLDFFHLFDSPLMLTLLYDSINLVIKGFSSGLLGHGSGERKSRVLQQLACVARTMHQCAVFWVSYFAR